ncbi:Vitamin K-dependent gamma-carboxylase [Chondromyces apiculatus DSM 436]|uniref:Vitamin K-dependent gamma-carboxylase n=1 Tax=Chondromyces apiculatus DSM 436 TaxID=1192034 RepID=A0A017TCU2_9BACT|nr:Vitamin K-dependent gamma-carboxylase [Chondromyces apiculatus DSM 436]
MEGGSPGGWKGWERHLFAEVDGASLALFRVAFGVLLAWEVVRYFANHRIQRYYIEPQIFFSYVDVIKPWHGQGMIWHFAALGVCALCGAAGLFYRVTAPLCCVGITYVFLLDKAEYLNHLYLCCLLSLLLAIAPAHRVFSLDRLRAVRRAARAGTEVPGEGVPRWALWILRFQVAVVYLFGAIAKLNADWLHGRPLDLWLPARAHLPLIGPLLALPTTALAVAYAGLLIDLAAPFLLLSRRGRPWGIGFLIAFHVANALIFSIGIFPWVMIAALALFPDPGWPRRLLGRRAVALREDAAGMPRRAVRALGMAALHGYVLVQILVPMRHWLYPGDVAWTESGHRFSWRMKLRNKKAEKLQIHLRDPVTGTREKVDPHAWLTTRQVKEMRTNPDLLTDFAHVLADRHEASRGVRPVVTARVMVSLNGHPARLLLDPETDLASEPRGVRRW